MCLDGFCYSLLLDTLSASIIGHSLLFNDTFVDNDNARLEIIVRYES